MPRGRHALRALVVWLAVVGLVAACSTGPGPTGDTAAPTPTETTTPRPELILGCTSIAADECRLVAEAVLGVVPADRGPAIAVEITLYGCPAAPGCARSLAARDGEIVIEFGDGSEPLTYAVSGPPDAPIVAEQEGFWSGRLVPQSPPAGGPGPFPFEVGHCGLWNSVDFDTSWWVPIGEVDGDIPAMINSEQGRIRLLTPTTAEYLSPAGARVTLARFPGAKHLRLCA